MINKNSKTSKESIKAVGLISGGLDSTLAAYIVKELGFEVHGVYFAMPWGCCDKKHAQECAEKLGIKFITLQLDERYLEVVRRPKFGRGVAMNPCTDCRIHMFSRAAQYMRHIGAEFIFTGDVLGQRPMSQKKERLIKIEDEIGLKGRLLRPLCAQLLEPTEMEKSGLIDRDKLFNMVGRSRKKQYELADKLEISGYSAPAGGCLLTNPFFASRMKDTLEHGYRNFRETISLKWGRHYRFSDQFKCILGRDEEENEGLIRYAHQDDIIMELPDGMGPTLILKGKNPSEKILSECAGLIKRFSKYKKDSSIEVDSWISSDKNNITKIKSRDIKESLLKEMKI